MLKAYGQQFDTIETPNTENTRVLLDWKAYYEEFVGRHGDPVVYKGRLLFKNGWMYSATDYGGPEWPPSKNEDELRSLQIAYWVLRKRIASKEHRKLQVYIAELEVLQSNKDMPLQHNPWDKDKQVYLARSIDLDPNCNQIEARLTWLKNDITECNDNLERLREKVDGVLK